MCTADVVKSHNVVIRDQFVIIFVITDVVAIHIYTHAYIYRNHVSKYYNKLIADNHVV